MENHETENLAEVTQPEESGEITAQVQAATPVVAATPVANPTPTAVEDAEQQMRRMSRRSFLLGGAAVATGVVGWRWLITRRTDDGIPWPFRRVLDSNGELARDYAGEGRYAPEFPASRVMVTPRVNGDIGLGEDFDPATWKLSLNGLASGETVEVTLKQIQSLPKVEMITELKCIEGWSMVVHWTGARLRDLVKKYPPFSMVENKKFVLGNRETWPPYVGMSTPDGGYYVGLDCESALHPQTLLCYAMNGQPLTAEHGAPLRLVIPAKYGVKNIKRLGSITFGTERPADYWAEQGYDWYAGL